MEVRFLPPERRAIRGSIAAGVCDPERVPSPPRPLQQLKNLPLERGMTPNPLQSSQNRRQLVAALQGEADQFNGRELQTRFGLESLAHSSECCTVLPAQCRKQTRFCNRPFLIRSTFASRRSNKLQKTPALFTFPAEH